MTSSPVSTFCPCQGHWASSTLGARTDTFPCVVDDNIQELAAELVQLGFISEVSRDSGRAVGPCSFLRVQWFVPFPGAGGLSQVPALGVSSHALSSEWMGLTPHCPCSAQADQSRLTCLLEEAFSKFYYTRNGALTAVTVSS